MCHREVCDWEVAPVVGKLGRYVVRGYVIGRGWYVVGVVPYLM